MFVGGGRANDTESKREQIGIERSIFAVGKLGKESDTSQRFARFLQKFLQNLANSIG
jgi:hypothetical protein